MTTLLYTRNIKMATSTARLEVGPWIKAGAVSNNVLTTYQGRVVKGLFACRGFFVITMQMDLVAFGREYKGVSTLSLKKDSRIYLM